MLGFKTSNNASETYEALDDRRRDYIAGRLEAMRIASLAVLVDSQSAGAVTGRGNP